MEGHVGDRLIVHGRRVGQSTSEGMIIEVLTMPSRHYRVRWADGHESMMYPGSDVTIERADETPPHPRFLSIEVRLVEDADTCQATATTMTATGTFTGRGEARRNPADPQVPMIGEELAIARSLRDLADGFTDAADAAMARRENRPVHLIQ